MKKFLFYALIISRFISNANAQGLENVIVEKYYISDANDATVNSTGGVLPVGSVTYRIYLDMLPDYIFQSAYGDPDHELRIETSTLFFNNEDRGAVHPTFNFNYCDDNTVMLDSWLSVGAACNSRLGILKSEDDGVATVINSDGVLQNNDPAMGIPLTQEDGLIMGTPEPVITVGIGNEIMVFDSQNDGTNGPVFSTMNGAWASVNGSVGPDPALNQVLIAQITTDGIFSFSLNVQIRNQITLAVENYVASGAMGNEILFPALNYPLNLGTSENISSEPSFGIYPVPSGNSITLALNAMDNSYKTSYAIYDLLGNLVMKNEMGITSGIVKHTVDLSRLNAGVYFVEMLFDDKSMVKKLIKQ